MFEFVSEMPQVHNSTAKMVTYEHKPVKEDEGAWGVDLIRVDKNTQLDLQINQFKI